MSDDLTRKHKLADAVPHETEASGIDRGKPTPTHATAAEQARESQESHEAQNAQSGLRDRLVHDGRAGDMGGRGGRRVGDQS